MIIIYDYRNCDMKLSQTKYIESLANRLQNNKLYSTPMETNLKIEKAEIYESDIKYRNLISALLYISSSTRPDISYSVNYVENNTILAHGDWRQIFRGVICSVNIVNETIILIF